MSASAAPSTTSTSALESASTSVFSAANPFSSFTEMKPLTIPQAPAPGADGRRVRGPFVVLVTDGLDKPCCHTFATEAEWRQELLRRLTDYYADSFEEDCRPAMEALSTETLITMYWDSTEGSLKDHDIFTVIEPITESGVANIWFHPYSHDKCNRKL